MLKLTNRVLTAAALALVSGTVMSVSAQDMQDNPMVGGQPMLATQDIVDNAVNSADHTTLVAAVQAAELVDALKGEGPLTVFAPTNAAFAKLPEGTVETLLEPENLETLQTILTYHVVAGALDREAILAELADNDTVELETLSGGTLTASLNGPSNVILTDAQGNTAEISTYDVYQSNGVIHVITSVLLPE